MAMAPGGGLVPTPSGCCPSQCGPPLVSPHPGCWDQQSPPPARKLLQQVVTIVFHIEISTSVLLHGIAGKWWWSWGYKYIEKPRNSSIRSGSKDVKKAYKRLSRRTTPCRSII